MNVFAVPELKVRRWLIAEPHLNAVIKKLELPKVRYPTRLARGLWLHHAKYLLQFDFTVYCGPIPKTLALRDNFIF